MHYWQSVFFFVCLAVPVLAFLKGAVPGTRLVTGNSPLRYAARAGHTAWHGSAS